METSTIISIQNQLVTHINKTIKTSIDDEIVVDKSSQPRDAVPH